MRSVMGLVMVGGLLLNVTGESRAQFSLATGNPYYGPGLSIGTPAGYSYGYPNYSSYSSYSGLGVPGYGVGYNNSYNSAFVTGPGTYSYSSGYRGFAPPVVPLNTFSYGSGVRPYYGGYGVRPYYGGYGYRNYGYGYRNGIGPIRGVGRMYR